MLKNLNRKTYSKLTYSSQLSGKNLRKRFFNLPGLLYYIMCELLLVWLYMYYNAWYHTCQGTVVFDWIFRKTKFGLSYVFYVIPILKEISIHFHRILINHEHKRYRKRSRKPAPWFEPRKTGKLTYGVTDENVADLKQQVWEDSFKPDSPIRAEFLERKGLTDNMIASQYQVDKNFKWKFKWEHYW